MRTVLLAALFLSGCSNLNYPSTSTEQWIASVVMNECKKLGVGVVTHWPPEDYEVREEVYGHSGLACMGATPDVVYVYPVCNTTIEHTQLLAYARHECCHAFLGHVTQLDPQAAQAQEVEAEACRVQRF